MTFQARYGLSALIVVVGVLGAFGQPMAGLVYGERIVFLSFYSLRESWLFVAAVVLLVLLGRALKTREVNSQNFLVVSIYFVMSVFVLLIGLSERTPSLMVVFLQFRNLFGFALAIVLVYAVKDNLDHERLFRVGVIIAACVVAYSFAELVVLLRDGYLISNEIFNKELLEKAKGTRADVGGGIFASLRIPGPLFNPSQLGIFAAYLIYAGTAGTKRFNSFLVLLLFGVVIMGFSKSAFVMIAMILLLRVFGRQVALLALLGFLFSPLILGLLGEFLSDYHLASISRHFEGYVSAVELISYQPLGSGVGSAGELASTLGGFESTAGYESGMGTILTNLGVVGLAFYGVLGLFCMLQPNRFFFDVFALWSVSMYFNESAMSPHLFVFQMCMAGSIMFSRSWSTLQPAVANSYEKVPV